MFELKVSTEFSAAHSLREYKGKCEELHGHNWKVELEVSSKGLDKAGMLVDFKELKYKLNKIIKRLDHQHLNKLPYFKKVNPTSENIAKYIFQELDKIHFPFKLERVTVWESDSSCASFRK